MMVHHHANMHLECAGLENSLIYGRKTKQMLAQDENKRKMRVMPGRAKIYLTRIFGILS
jgi:hypothetical protein